jgi:hypothetical protein
VTHSDLTQGELQKTLSKPFSAGSCGDGRCLVGIALLCLILGRVPFCNGCCSLQYPNEEGTKTALVLLPSDHFRLTNPYVDSFERNDLQEHSITNIHHAGFILERVIPVRSMVPRISRQKVRFQMHLIPQCARHPANTKACARED